MLKFLLYFGMTKFRMIMILAILNHIIFGCALNYEKIKKVIELNDTAFESIVLKEGKLWIIDFYAPWCGHCKKLSPVLDDLASNIPKEMFIGKLDATRCQETAKKYKVSSYPTLLYFNNGTYGEYDGGRNYLSILSFMQRMQAPIVTQITHYNEINNIMLQNKIHSTSFLLKDIRHHETSKQEEIKNDIIRHSFYDIAEKMRSKVNFIHIIEYSDNIQIKTTIERIESQQKNMELPIVIENDNRKNSHVDSIEYNSTEIYNQIEIFIMQFRFPTITVLDSDTFTDIINLGLKVAILVLDTNDHTSEAIINDYNQIISYIPLSSQMNYIKFGLINGIKFKKFILDHDVIQFPSILVLDPVTHEHNTTLLNIANIKSDMTKILNNLLHIQLPYYNNDNKNELYTYTYEKLIFKRSKSSDDNILKRIKRKFESMYPWSLLIFVPLLLLILSYFIPFPNDDDHNKSD